MAGGNFFARVLAALDLPLGGVGEILLQHPGICMVAGTGSANRPSRAPAAVVSSAEAMPSSPIP